MLTFGKFRFTIQAIEPLELPAAKGSMLRGAFGWQLRKLVCITKQPTCDGCPYLANCVYSYFYATVPPADSKLMRKYRTAPHPYVFEVDPGQAEQRLVPPAATFSFSLILIGKSVDFIPHIIYAFEQVGINGMGKNRRKFHLKEVHNIPPSGQPVLLYAGRFVDRVEPLFSWEYTLPASPVREMEIMFHTPVRVKDDGRLANRLEFAVLARALLSRLSLLTYFHCGAEMACDFYSMVEAAGKVETTSCDCRWRDITRYSSAQDCEMQMGGLLGKVCYRGELTPFIPYVEACRHLHVGKGTSFGLGNYSYQTKE